MTNDGLRLLEKFIANERLAVHELKFLQTWMGDNANKELINDWMLTGWKYLPEIESTVSFDELVVQIDRQFNAVKKIAFWDQNWVKQFQKIAAIIILPIVLFASYYFIFIQNGSQDYSEVIVPKGQKSEIVLPDGTHIWLNSATTMRYPIKFGNGARHVYLDGEAYFEVAENKYKPFLVNTSNLTVKVLGTRFNVKAYADEKEIETALLSGKVNLLFGTSTKNIKTIAMNPGELINYSKEKNRISKSGFETDEVVAWKNNRLVFRNDTFNNLVKKIERWYNVQIIYDQSLFKDQRLTVELMEGESLERLFHIIERAINVDYKIDNQKIYINQKMN